MFGRHAAGIEENRKLIEILKATVCENQGKLAEYAFIAAEKHKTIRKSLDACACDLDNLKELLDDLERYVSSEFCSICDVNFSYIHKYFENRSYQPPRICIKLSQNDCIVDPNIRDNGSYITPAHYVSENTGFYNVDRSGKWFLCNDIPSEAKVGNYRNVRLQDHLVRNYKTPSFYWLRSKLSKNFIDREWANCWTTMSENGNDSIRPRVEACYKSTLIIPMTLIGNSLSAEFKNKFDIMQFHEKAIFGFLCFDHQHADYFEEHNDVRMGYIFADLLSLYLVHQMVYTSKSKTISKAIELVGMA